MAEQVANVVLVVKFRADPQRQAFHREQIFRLRHHDAQMIEVEERRESATLAHKTLHAVVEPVGRQARLDRHPGGRLADLAHGSKESIDILGRRPRGVGEAHHRPAH